MQNEMELAPDKNKTGTAPLRIEPNTERTMEKQEVFAIIPVRYPNDEGSNGCAAYSQLNLSNILVYLSGDVF